MSSPEFSTGNAWIPASLAPAGDGLRLEFALAAAGEALAGSVPFTSLGDTGRFSRVYLARLADADGRTLRPLACKLQRDAYRGGARGAGRTDNREVEATWQRERDHMLRLAGRWAPAPLMTALGGDPLPPTAYDLEQRALFPVLAPRTFEPLVVCRDDDALRAAGLEPWSTGLQRYLHCRSEPQTFYCWTAPAQGTRPAAGVRVVTGLDLYAELAESWAALDGTRRAALQTSWPAGARALDGVDAATATGRFVPLCFHPAAMLLVDFEHLHFDEFCWLAGGATVAQLADRARKTSAAGRQFAFALLQRRLDRPFQWWSLPWARGDAPQALAGEQDSALRRLAAEATLLKLQAWLQVCRAVRHFHRTMGEPHLGLSVDNVMLTFDGHEAAPAPVRWGFRAGLVDACSSRVVQLDGLAAEGTIPTLFRPSPNAVRSFVSPQADLGRPALELSVKATARPLEGSAGLRLELHAPHERFTGVHAGDVVRVLPDVPLPGSGAAALLGLVEDLGSGGRSVTAVVRLPDGVGAADREFAFAATAVCYPRLGMECDLFSLGMLLACALLVNDERDEFAVREVWDRVLDKFDVELAARTTDAATTERAMGYLLDAEAQHLGSSAVLADRAVRGRVPAPLPPGLWRQMLLLIGRLLTRREHFSFASPATAGDAANADPLTAVLAAGEELQARLLAELHGAARNEELAQVVTAVQRQVTASMVQDGGPA